MADYFGPGVNPAPFQPGGLTPTYTGPQVNPSLYPGAMGTTGPGPSLWDRLTNALGRMSAPGAMGAPGAAPSAPQMPGTTVGAPAGAASMAPPATPVPQQMQMPRPPGVPSFNSLPMAGGFNVAQQPTSNSGLLAQYAALQQLMRGS